MSRIILPLALIAAALFAAACGGDDDAPPAISVADAEARLSAAVLRLDDIGGDYMEHTASVRTNEQQALARPDPDVAREQYEEWGQVLGYNVRYDAPPSADLLLNNKTARVMNAATLYTSEKGAASALDFVRGVPPEAIAAFIQSGNSGGEATLSDTRVTKDIEFPARGDESFAFRVAGKATFPDGFTVNYVADVVFVRVGATTGNVVTIALGQPPQRDELVALLDRFIEKVRAAG